MKTSSPRNNIRRLLALLLCCLLTAGCLGTGAAAADEEAPPAGTVEPVEPTEPAGPVDPAVPDGPAEPVGTDEPAATEPDGTETEPPAGEEEEPPVSGNVTVTFDFGPLGTETETLLPGEKPGSVPDLTEKYPWQGYVFVCWTDGSGEPVEPAELPVDEDTVYTARLERRVELLLNTDEHKAYISGKSNEIFDPQGSLTRGEAAAIFSNLLRTKDFDHKVSFKDVKSTDWYADAAGLMYTLGIAKGSSEGYFRPKSNITRAEFVTMAASCATPVEGDCPFTDVPESHWARPYITTAYANGWVSGHSDGTFDPDSGITRAEAVVIINHVLGRQPDGNIKYLKGVRSFCDVFASHWAYGNIIEASTDHEFTATGADGEPKDEQWTTYTRYETTKKRGWLTMAGKRYYIGSDGKCLRGQQTIKGAVYRFDSTGAGITGFYNDGSWRRYYKDGARLDDISNLGVVKGPYYIKVYKPANYLIVFAKDSATGKYTIPVRSMITSCGNPTPTGDYYTPARYRWLQMVGGSWAQWCTQIYSGYLFHSVPNDQRNNYTMWSGEFNNLGTTRSLGCIRLTCADAKWIYDNCALGTHVYISPTETSGPLKRPAGIKIPSWHTWDPTDPTAQYLCRQHGCH